MTDFYKTFYDYDLSDEYADLMLAGVMGRASHRGMFSLPSDEDYAIAEGAARTLNVEKLLDKRCTELSGGEKQLINVCRAIAQEPRAMLFDEPTSSVDVCKVDFHSWICKINFRQYVQQTGI